MTIYEPQSGVSGKWIKADELPKGIKAKIKTEAKPEPSRYTNKDGSMKMQDVCKVLIQGSMEPVNASLNKATIHALIEAFGKDSKEWIDKVLTVETMRMLVSGKMTTAVFFLPEGYELGQDDGGYMVVRKIGSGQTSGLTQEAKDTIKAARDAEIAFNSLDQEEVINPDDIPF